MLYGLQLTLEQAISAYSALCVKYTSNRLIPIRGVHTLHLVSKDSFRFVQPSITMPRIFNYTNISNLLL